MSNFKFSNRSINNLKEVHPWLVILCHETLKHSPVDFGITEGKRSIEKQREYVAAGKSQTMNSYHLDGDAIDFACYVDGKLTWQWNYYEQVSKVFKEKAKELGIEITWGGDWVSFKDGVHIQLENV